MAVLGSSGGGAGDTYTASTAEAGVPVESGRSYALSSDGKLFPSNMLVAKQVTHPVPNSVAGASGYQYALNVFGDMVTPDGKATFHFIADDGGRPLMIDDTGVVSNNFFLESNSSNTTYASIEIPTGFKATHVKVNGSATDAITVFEMQIDSKTGVSKGTGNVGTEINITDVTSSTTNYLLINVDNASGNEIHGGYVTIAAV